MRHASRLVVSLVAVVLVSAVLVPGLLPAQDRELVTIASGWVTGVYYPVSGAISRILWKNKAVGIRATVESSGASVANAKLIGSGEADFALLQNDIAFYAYNGVQMFEGEAIKNMGGIFTIYPELIQVLATRSSGVTSVKDLKGKRVAIGPLGSGTAVNTTQILEAHGLTLDDLGKVDRIGAAQASGELKDGRIDAAFFTTGLGSAVIRDTMLTGKVAMVPVTGPDAEALLKKYPYYSRTPVPAGTYRGQDESIETVAVMAMMVAKAELPEELVYKTVKAIFDDLEQFHQAHLNAKKLTLESALEAMPIPLHPGAARFYKEKGLQ